ncbi:MULTISPECIES: ABC transporter permease [Bifidobacterium]|uniref:ABC transporter permease n=1 Tax=Bifidobacterium tissieri TaxID=1630162 RepID=A0A5M9ZS94_9BIFI|nr:MULTISPECIES: ABC transporter permease [Bifidobacterium]KAA8827629.1 ABC transporter permease [Bifidobacterium tissieri]KAA8830345.1 ABC transporter permease [Bifidobacterium tissieri]TPF96087.1 ABC transporter permease [Bifidobacterium sp. UTCIF-39]
MTNRRMFFAMIFGAVFRRRSRAVMAVVSSMVGAATLFCLAAVCLVVPQQMSAEMRAYGANLIVTPNETSSAAGLSAETVANVEKTVTADGAAKSATYRYETVRINSAPYVLGGIDVNQVRDLNRHWVVDGKWPSEGRVLVGRDVADAMGLEIGSAIKIAYRESDNAASSSDSGTTSGTASGDSGTSGTSGTTAGTTSAETQAQSTGQSTRDGRVSSDILNTDGTEFRVAGIVDTGGSEDEIVYATNDDLTKLAGERGSDVIEFSSEASADQLTQLVNTINKNTTLGVKAQQVSKITSSNTRIITMLQTLFWLVSVVVLVLTLVGVSTTMASIVSQRRNEIGLRKALGASSASIGAEFYVESALYGLLGGVIGTGIGYVFARVLCQTVFDRSLEFNWLLGLASVVLSVLIAVVASIVPVRRASRIDPAIVLREE